jgi:hybrid cluster-associated redox disulfide protein
MSKGAIFMAQVTKDTIIIDALRMDEGTAQFFLEIGMHCLGCPSSSGESIEQACLVHGEDPDALVARINGFLADRGK